MLCTYRVYRFDVPTRSWVLVLNTRLYRDAVDLHKQLMVHGQRAIINVDPYKFKRNLPADPDKDIMKGRSVFGGR